MTRGAEILSGAATGFSKAAIVVDGQAVKLYNGAVIVGGQTVKIFSAGVEIVSVTLGNWITDDDGNRIPTSGYDPGSGLWNVSMDSEGITFSINTSHSYNSTNVHDCVAQISLPVDKQPDSTELLRFLGQITYSVTNASHLTAYVSMNASGGGATMLLDCGSSKSGSDQIDVTLTGTTPDASTYDFLINAYVALDNTSTFACTVTIPWSALTWLPTDDEILYNL